jgi:hypothetical protein
MLQAYLMASATATKTLGPSIFAVTCFSRFRWVRDGAGKIVCSWNYFVGGDEVVFIHFNLVIRAIVDNKRRYMTLAISNQTRSRPIF